MLDISMCIMHMYYNVYAMYYMYNNLMLQMVCTESLSFKIKCQNILYKVILAPLHFKTVLSRLEFAQAQLCVNKNN